MSIKKIILFFSDDSNIISENNFDNAKKISNELIQRLHALDNTFQYIHRSEWGNPLEDEFIVYLNNDFRLWLEEFPESDWEKWLPRVFVIETNSKQQFYLMHKYNELAGISASDKLFDQSDYINISAKRGISSSLNQKGINNVTDTNILGFDMITTTDVPFLSLLINYIRSYVEIFPETFEEKEGL